MSMYYKYVLSFFTFWDLKKKEQLRTYFSLSQKKNTIEVLVDSRWRDIDQVEGWWSYNNQKISCPMKEDSRDDVVVVVQQ